MSETVGFLIRDGVEQDIAACLALDHSYQTDLVWQMSIQQTPGTWQITFKTERLPRTMDVIYPADEHRLRCALADEQCLLVVVGRDVPEILGYAAMRHDPTRHIALLQDLVIAREYRQRGIGARLLNVARRWAKERGLEQMIAEVQTKNYPGISFCQQTGFTFCGFNDQYFSNQDIAVFFGQALR